MSNQNNQTSTPSNVSEVLFQDAMDPTRFVRIREEKKNTVICKVWFGKSKDNLFYHGTTELPKSLFFFAGGSRTGFNPAREKEEPKPGQVRELRRRHRDEDDDSRRAA